MRFTPFLVHCAGRNVKVKRLLKGQLRLVRKTLPTIPSCGSQSAGGVVQSVKQLREGLIGRIFISSVVHRIRRRIVELSITTNPLPDTIDSTKIRFYICTPLPLDPTVTGSLDTSRRIHRETGRAAGFRRIDVISKRIACDAHVIGLTKVVHPIACPRLLFCRNDLRHLLVGFNIYEEPYRPETQ